MFINEWRVDSRREYRREPIRNFMTENPLSQLDSDAGVTKNLLTTSARGDHRHLLVAIEDQNAYGLRVILSVKSSGGFPSIQLEAHCSIGA
jgi:hypothetical protein